MRANALWKLLQTTQDDAARRAQLDQQLADERSALETAEADAAQSGVEVAFLMVLAGATDRPVQQALIYRLTEQHEANAAALTHRDASQGAVRDEGSMRSSRAYRPRTATV